MRQNPHSKTTYALHDEEPVLYEKHNEEETHKNI
jgi:hypothetical protein